MGWAVLAVTAIATAASADTLVLHEEAFVKGPTVQLGDVADIEGARATSLAEIDVISAASPGGSKQINASLVASRLRSAGVDPTSVEIKGAPRVRATTLHADVSKEMVALSLRNFIQANMPWDPAQAEIEVPLPLRDFVVPDGVIELSWRAKPEYRYLGDGAFRCTVLVDGQVQRSLLCKATIEAYGSVVTLARDMPRGRLIGPQDIEMRAAALSALPRDAVLHPEEAVGKLARRTLFAGQALGTRDIEARTLVRRNQRVPVELHSGGLQIHGRAIAQADARVGDVIRCLNERSKEEFFGVVREDGVVVVN